MQNTTVAEMASYYIPLDRRYALARGDSIPDRVTGAALFADISGYTPLPSVRRADLSWGIPILNWWMCSRVPCSTGSPQPKNMRNPGKLSSTR